MAKMPDKHRKNSAAKLALTGKIWSRAALPRFFNRKIARAVVSSGFHESLDDAYIELSDSQLKRIERRRKIQRAKQEDKPVRRWTEAPLPKRKP